jgi:hypothetical protein
MAHHFAHRIHIRQSHWALDCSTAVKSAQRFSFFQVFPAFFRLLPRSDPNSLAILLVIVTPEAESHAAQDSIGMQDEGGRKDYGSVQTHT